MTSVMATPAAPMPFGRAGYRLIAGTVQPLPRSGRRRKLKEFRVPEFNSLAF